MTPRALAAVALLCLPLVSGCGERLGQTVEPVTKLVAQQEVLAPPAGAAPSSAPTAAPSCPSGYVALTFDDGPSPITPRFISYLSAHHVPATFFVVGSRMAYQVPIVQRAYRAGFAIGNHTWAHADLPLLSDDAVKGEVRSTAAEFRRSGIKPTNLVRPPYGATNPRVQRILAGLHLRTFQWTIDSEDWLSGDPRTIAGRVIARIRPHRPNVVLMHDGLSAAVRGRVASAQTIGAVPLVVFWVRQHGYCLTQAGRPGWSAILAAMSWRPPVMGQAGGTASHRSHAPHQSGSRPR